MVSWTLVGLALVMLAGVVFSVLIVLGLSRSASGGDVDWQLDRIERKVDLILTHLGIGHDDHIPQSVIDLARAGRELEAVQEYCRLTGVRLSVARREVAYLVGRIRGNDGEHRGGE